MGWINRVALTGLSLLLTIGAVNVEAQTLEEGYDVQCVDDPTSCFYPGSAVPAFAADWIVAWIYGGACTGCGDELMGLFGALPTPEEVESELLFVGAPTFAARLAYDMVARVWLTRLYGSPLVPIERPPIDFRDDWAMGVYIKISPYAYPAWVCQWINLATREEWWPPGYGVPEMIVLNDGYEYGP